MKLLFFIGDYKMRIIIWYMIHLNEKKIKREYN